MLGMTLFICIIWLGGFLVGSTYGALRAAEDEAKRQTERLARFKAALEQDKGEK